MTMTRLLGAAAAAALLAGAAHAQTPPTLPTETTPPVATPPTVTPAAPATSATTATPATPAPATASATPTTPKPAAPTLVARGDIVETLKANGQFKTLIKGLEATNMTGVLKTNTNLTVFAPTDAAFAALPAGELDRLMKNPAALQKLLTYHVVNASVDSSKIKGAKGGVATVAGGELIVDGSGGALMANTATIVQADVRPTNGVIHVIDKVLTPETAPSVAATATTGATTDAAATAPATVPPPPARTTPESAPPAGENVDPPMPSGDVPGVATPDAETPAPTPQR
ncbi:MAG: fasciclin domain-containing protein [Caulobacter sp.]|nr:fasciclin domain-containing protein [Caulobacter sp.]